MIKIKKIHNANDVTNIYFSNTIPKILHKHFRLPGKFVRNYTTRIIKRDGSEGEMDWLILVEPDNCRLFEKILINVEFQSSQVTLKKIKMIAEYKDYAKTYYGLPVLTVIIITDGYESSELEYSRVSSDILRPIYINMTWDEIIEKLNNIEEKINNHEQLSEDDGLNMVYLPMFAPKKEAKWLTEKMTHLFIEDDSLKRSFKDHIGHGLSFMIKKYFNVSKSEELLNMLENNVDDSKLRIIAEFEDDYARRVFEHELAEKDSQLAEKDKIIAENNLQAKNLLEIKEQEINVLKAKLHENGISF